MPKLILSMDGAFLGEYPIHQTRMTVGRRSTSDIHIDHPTISGQHALITVIGDSCILEDLNSTNGTRVNGKPTRERVLHHGDVIELGKYHLRYENEGPLCAAMPSPAASVSVYRLDENGQPRARVRVLTGASAGKEADLTKALTTLGKPGIQVAVISRRSDGFFLTHVEGDHPPVVNGTALGTSARALIDHDVIQVAGVEMLFYFLEAA